MAVRRAVRHVLRRRAAYRSPWTNPDNPRCAILIAYNHVTVRFHEPKPCMNPAVIGGMSAAHQKFFQDVWLLSNAQRNKQGQR